MIQQRKTPKSQHINIQTLLKIQKQPSDFRISQPSSNFKQQENDTYFKPSINQLVGKKTTLQIDREPDLLPKAHKLKILSKKNSIQDNKFDLGNLELNNTKNTSPSRLKNDTDSLEQFKKEDPAGPYFNNQNSLKDLKKTFTGWHNNQTITGFHRNMLNRKNSTSA